MGPIARTLPLSTSHSHVASVSSSTAVSPRTASSESTSMRSVPRRLNDASTARTRFTAPRPGLSGCRRPTRTVSTVSSRVRAERIQDPMMIRYGRPHSCRRCGSRSRRARRTCRGSRGLLARRRSSRTRRRRGRAGRRRNRSRRAERARATRDRGLQRHGGPRGEARGSGAGAAGRLVDARAAHGPLLGASETGRRRRRFAPDA